MFVVFFSLFSSYAEDSLWIDIYISSCNDCWVNISFVFHDKDLQIKSFIHRSTPHPASLGQCLRCLFARKYSTKEMCVKQFWEKNNNSRFQDKSFILYCAYITIHRQDLNRFITILIPPLAWGCNFSIYKILSLVKPFFSNSSKAYLVREISWIIWRVLWKAGLGWGERHQPPIIQILRWFPNSYIWLAAAEALDLKRLLNFKHIDTKELKSFPCHMVEIPIMYF